MLDRSLKRLGKKARRGMRGYPIGTVAGYGPDDKHASELVTSVRAYEGADMDICKWFSDQGDVPHDPAIAAQVLAFFEEAGVKSVATLVATAGRMVH